MRWPLRRHAVGGAQPDGHCGQLRVRGAGATAAQDAQRHPGRDEVAGAHDGGVGGEWRNEKNNLKGVDGEDHADLNKWGFYPSRFCASVLFEVCQCPHCACLMDFNAALAGALWPSANPSLSSPLLSSPLLSSLLFSFPVPSPLLSLIPSHHNVVSNQCTPSHAILYSQIISCLVILPHIISCHLRT